MSGTMLSKISNHIPFSQFQQPVVGRKKRVRGCKSQIQQPVVWGTRERVTAFMQIGCKALPFEVINGVAFSCAFFPFVTLFNVAIASTTSCAWKGRFQLVCNMNKQANVLVVAAVVSLVFGACVGAIWGVSEAVSYSYKNSGSSDAFSRSMKRFA